MIRPPAASRRTFAIAAIALACTGAEVLAQQAERVRDTLVKAAFLYRFTGFVEWPSGSFPGSDSPIRIGVLGDDEVLRDLREVARESAKDGRPVVVVRLLPGETLNNLHVVYLRGLSAVRATEFIASVPEGVLTVVDADGQHPPGAVLSFFLEDGRVRFGASVAAATRQRLRLSSRLLTIARQVQGSREPDVELAARHGGGDGPSGT